MNGLDPWETSTAVCALVHYALHVADPSECVRVLDKLSPHPDGSWQDSITEARDGYRALINSRDPMTPQPLTPKEQSE